MFHRIGTSASGSTTPEIVTMVTALNVVTHNKGSEVRKARVKKRKQKEGVGKVEAYRERVKRDTYSRYKDEG